MAALAYSPSASKKLIKWDCRKTLGIAPSSPLISQNGKWHGHSQGAGGAHAHFLAELKESVIHAREMARNKELWDSIPDWSVMRNASNEEISKTYAPLFEAVQKANKEISSLPA